MARCASEREYPSEGLGWRPPDLSSIRLETDRLVIRSYELDDVDAVFRAIDSCRDELLPWMVWVRTQHLEPASTAQYIAAQIMNTRRPETWDGIGLGVFLKETGEYIGGSGVHDVRRDTASCETGYWIHTAHTGRGYATEVCRRAIDWALCPQNRGGLGLRRVRIFCSSANPASIRVIEKLGIRKEVEMPGDYWVEGYGCTTRLGWGVLADEWNGRTVTG